MILTLIPNGQLPQLLSRFEATLDPAAAQVFRRIADPTKADRAQAAAAVRDHAMAVRVSARVGMPLRPGRPQDDYSWDGSAARMETEAYVLLHEIAHYQLASPERRCHIDFGLGPGPETGDRAGAERDATVFGLAREREEAMASLLGIMWEAELGQPALASFLDQNWLEGAGRPGAAEHFAIMLALLRAGGFVDATGRPSRRLRRWPDTVAMDERRLA